MKNRTEIIGTVLFLLVSVAYIFVFSPGEWVTRMELSQKLFNLAFYTTFSMLAVIFFGGFGFDVIAHFKRQEQTTALFFGLWLIGVALVLMR